MLLTQLKSTVYVCVHVCAGFEACVESCKSLMLTCGLFEGKLSVEEAANIASLEVRFQVTFFFGTGYIISLDCLCIVLFRLADGERWSGNMDWRILT